MFRNAILALSLFATAAQAAECKKPIYKSVNPKISMVIRFLGAGSKDGNGERGIIQTTSPKHVFKFTTTFSNGFSLEHLILEGVDDVDSQVMRKNPDFTAAQSTAAFILLPDLPVKFYYATMNDHADLHDVLFDDTWKLIGCGDRR